CSEREGFSRASVRGGPRAHCGHIMKTTIAALCLLTVTLAAQAPDAVDARAARLHKAAIVVDTHIDTTQMLGRPGWDFIARAAPGGPVWRGTRREPRGGGAAESPTRAMSICRGCARAGSTRPSSRSTWRARSPVPKR